MANTTITRIKYRTIFDSRGVETLEVDVFTEGGGRARCAGPFGAPGSRGEFEAPAYARDGIAGSIAILRDELLPKLLGHDAADQEGVDRLLQRVDGTPNFERLGGNPSTVVSVACAQAAADALGHPLFELLGNPHTKPSLPYPLGNIIGGGAHSLGPAPDMQEHLVVPLGVATVRQAIEVNLEVHELVGKLLEKRIPSFAGGTDDENAWVADLDDVGAFEVVAEACAQVSARQGVEVRMGLDAAADRLWDPRRRVYRYEREGRERTPEEQLDYLTSLVERFNMIYVEDGFHSNDYDAFAALNARVGGRCLVCADDIYASNAGRTLVGIEKKSARAMILKTNQVGSVTGVRSTCLLAQQHGLFAVFSHRSGETPDDSIAHLAVGLNALMLKTGVKGGERLAKLNELIRIEADHPTIRLVPWNVFGKEACRAS
ncbi:MAG: hypothetical protein ACE147_10535 [Candidatus Methylomirabilales bacterium]